MANKVSFYVNRRLISTLLSVGKGHMDLHQTFSMGINMPGINHSAYNKHIIKINDTAKQHTGVTLKRAKGYY